MANTTTTSPKYITLPDGTKIPVPPAAASGKQASAERTSSPRSLAEAPVGIPYNAVADPNNPLAAPTYVAKWAPGPGQQPPRVNADGSRGWYTNSDTVRPATLDPAQVQTIQEQLVQAGLETADKVHWGIWSADDQNAYLDVLGYANQHAVDSTTALQELASHPNTPTVQLASPIDVNSVADQVIPDVLGRKLSDSEKQNLVEAWNKYQIAQAQNVPNGPGASQESSASLSDFATQYEQQQNPGDYAHHSQTKVLDWLHSALGAVV